MGQSKYRRAEFLRAHPLCVFCGGTTPATTVEHCPPRAFFQHRIGPEGFEFPACNACNSGTSDADVIVSVMGRFDPAGGFDSDRRLLGMTLNANKQTKGALRESMRLSATEGRQAARRLGMTPAPGKTHSELPVARVVPQMATAVKLVAAKLTKGLCYMHTGAAFPASGEIAFHWFTNATLAEHGSIAILEVMSAAPALPRRIERNGRDLTDQFDYMFSLSEDATLGALRVAFGRAFGFATFFCTVPGRLTQIIESARSEAAREGPGPFEML